MGGVEAETEDVVVLDVQDAGGHLEDDPADDHDSESRSSRLAAERTGGQANSFGMTDHSLASTTGTRTNPSPTCSPSVSWNSHAGRVGQSKKGRWRKPTWAGNGLVKLGPVGDVVEKAGDDHQRQGDQQQKAQNGGQPRAPQRTPPHPSPSACREVDVRRASSTNPPGNPNSSPSIGCSSVPSSESAPKSSARNTSFPLAVPPAARSLASGGDSLAAGGSAPGPLAAGRSPGSRTPSDSSGSVPASAAAEPSSPGPVAGPPDSGPGVPTTVGVTSPTNSGSPLVRAGTAGSGGSGGSGGSDPSVRTSALSLTSSSISRTRPTSWAAVPAASSVPPSPGPPAVASVAGVSSPESAGSDSSSGGDGLTGRTGWTGTDDRQCTEPRDGYGSDQARRSPNLPPRTAGSRALRGGWGQKDSHRSQSAVFPALFPLHPARKSGHDGLISMDQVR